MLVITGGSPMSMNLPPYSGFGIGRPGQRLPGRHRRDPARARRHRLFPRLFALFQLLRHPDADPHRGRHDARRARRDRRADHPVQGAGADEANCPGEYTTLSVGSLAIITGIKLVAMLVAATAGFRGGRIFPTAFIGLAFGLLASALFPAIPAAIAVACSILGIGTRRRPLGLAGHLPGGGDRARAADPGHPERRRVPPGYWSPGRPRDASTGKSAAA